MKNNWFYRFLAVAIFLSMTNIQAQSNDLLLNSDMRRYQSKLAVDVLIENEVRGRILKKEQLQRMLSKEQFYDYRMAHNCYIASIPLISLGTGFSILGLGILLVMENRFSAGILFLLSTGIGITFLTPGIALIVFGKNELNRIAVNYNKQRQSSYFQNGLQVNFGLVDNGIGVKLRF